MTISNGTLKSWPLKTYTNDVWTDLVVGTANGDSVKGIIISNTAVVSGIVTIQVADSGGTALATVLPAVSMSSGIGQLFDVGVLNLTSSQKLQVKVNVAGFEFYASGITYS